MPLVLIRTGFTAGLMFLAAFAVLGRLTREDRPAPVVLGPDLETDDQVYQVLADARRILEDG
jgi:hypothetical protein